MPSRIWYFKSEPHCVARRVMFRWLWRTSSPEGAAISSEQRFATLVACVRDAQENGFTGSVDSTSGAFGGDGYEITVIDDGGSALTAIRPR